MNDKQLQKFKNINLFSKDIANTAETMLQFEVFGILDEPDSELYEEYTSKIIENSRMLQEMVYEKLEKYQV